MIITRICSMQLRKERQSHSELNMNEIHKNKALAEKARTKKAEVEEKLNIKP